MDSRAHGCRQGGSGGTLKSLLVAAVEEEGAGFAPGLLALIPRAALTEASSFALRASEDRLLARGCDRPHLFGAQSRGHAGERLAKLSAVHASNPISLPLIDNQNRLPCEA